MRRHKLSVDVACYGAVCSVCKGHGSLEPFSARLQNRLTPLLALLIVYIAIALIWLFRESEHFAEVLAFGGTLTGSITGHYFASRQRASR